MLVLSGVGFGIITDHPSVRWQSIDSINQRYDRWRRGGFGFTIRIHFRVSPDELFIYACFRSLSCLLCF